MFRPSLVSRAPSFVTNQLQRIFAFGLLLIVALAIYLPGLHGGFVLDDDHNIAPAKLDELSFSGLAYAVSTNVSGPTKRPVSVLSFALTQYFFGYDPAAFKVINIIIHLINGVLVFLLVTRCFRLVYSSPSYGRPTPTGPVVWWAALLATILWTLSPMHVSTVLYAVQRMTLLATFFSLAAILLYIEARSALVRNEAGKYWSLVVGSLICILLAVLSKENGILAVPLIFVLEITVLNSLKPRLPWQLGPKTVRFLTALTVLGLLGILVMAVHAAQPGYAFRAFSMTERVATQPYVLLHYLWQMTVPYSQDLKFYYDDMAPVRFASGQFVLGVLFWAVILIGALLYQGRHSVPFRFGVLFFLLGQSMESSFWPLELAFEHRNYLPSVGFFFVASYFTVELFLAMRRTGAHDENGHSRINGRGLIIVTVGFVILFNALQLHERVTVWADQRFFNRIMAIYSPGSLRAQLEVAKDYLREGQIGKGKEAIDQLGLIRPDELGVPLLAMQVACQTKTITASQMDKTVQLAGTLPVSPLAIQALQSLLDVVASGKCPGVSEGSFSRLAKSIYDNKRSAARYYTSLLYAYSLYLDKRLESAREQFRVTSGMAAPEQASRVFTYYHLGVISVMLGDGKGATEAMQTIKRIQGDRPNSQEIRSLEALIKQHHSR